MASEDDIRHRRTYELLDEHTTKKYFIEYHGGLFNHMSHALYALDKLKAPIDLTENFVQWMVDEKMEAAETHKARRGTSLSQTDGTYYDIYEEYEKLFKEKYGGSLEELIAGEFPKLRHGMMASALHSPIHIGYGYAAKRDWFIIEGLAYLKGTSMPFQLKNKAPDLETLGLGSVDILDVVDMVREDADLAEVMQEAIKSLGEVNRFSRKANIMMEKRSDRIFEYVHKIKFPEELNAANFTFEAMPKLVKWIVDCAIIVYATVEKLNDFFLLHGVTCAWGLLNILPLLKTKEDVFSTVQTFLAGLILVYLVQGCPKMNRTLLEKNPGMQFSWDLLVKQAVEHQEYEREHMFKLVQVCRDMSNENSDPKMESMYRLASHICVTNHFVPGKATLDKEKKQKDA